MLSKQPNMKKILLFLTIVLFSGLVSAADVTFEYEVLKGDLLIGDQPAYILHFQNNEDVSHMISIKSIDLHWILKEEGEYFLDKNSKLDLPINYEPLGEIERREQGINLVVEVGDNRYEKVLSVNPIDYSKLVNLEFAKLPTLDSKKTTKLGITVINPYQVDLKGIKLNLNINGLFNSEQVFDLSKKEAKLIEFPIQVDANFLEGTYPATVSINYNNQDLLSEDFSVNVQKYQDIKSEPTIEESFLKTIKTIVYKNNGNNLLNETHVEKFSYLASKFTKLEPAPKQFDDGIATWEVQLKPGESLTIKATTSYRSPLTILIILIIIAYGIYYFTYKPLRLSKTVLSLKGGQDHYKKLKVKLKIKNISRKNLDEIIVSDKIPGTTRMPSIERGPHPRHIGTGANSITLGWALQLRKGESTTIIYNIDENVNISKARLIFSPAKAKCIYRGKQYTTKS